MIVNQICPLAFMLSLIGFNFWFGNALTVASLFATMNNFQSFNKNLLALPFTLSDLYSIMVSGERVNDCLLSEECDTKDIQWAQEETDTNDYAIEVNNKSFYWVDPRKVELIQEKKDYIEWKSNRGLCETDCCKKSDKKKTGVSGKTSAGRKNNNASKVQDKKNENSLTGPLITPDISESSYLGKESDKLMLERKEDENVADSYAPIINLPNLNLKIRKGACVALIGKVGSGKTSVLSSLFGELYDFDHKKKTVDENSEPEIGVKLNGSVAYVSQKAWIQSKSVKDNI